MPFQFHISFAKCVRIAFYLFDIPLFINTVGLFFDVYELEIIPESSRRLLLFEVEMNRPTRIVSNNFLNRYLSNWL